MIGKISHLLVGVLGAIVAGLALVFLSGFANRIPPWQFDESHLFAAVFAGAALSFSLVMAIVIERRKPSLRYRLIRNTVIGLVVAVPMFVLLLMLTDDGLAALPSLDLEKPVIGLIFFGFFGFLLLSAFLQSKWWLLIPNVLLLAALVVPVSGADSRSNLRLLVSGEATMFDTSVQTHFSSLHDVRVEDFTLFPKALQAAGGGMSVVDENRVLLVTGMGDVRLLTIGESAVALTDASGKTPFNRDAYRSQVTKPSQWFRLTDAVLDSNGSIDSRALLISYHYWDSEQECIALRVAQSIVDFNDFGNNELEWKVLHTTEPCMQTPLYNGTGGRIALYENNSILLTVGESFGEWEPAALAQSEYGKILKIDRTSGASEVFTSGHRNPQGLFIDGDEIWSTEHGPHGGDELNLVVKGDNFGWPENTYGTDYGKKLWPGESAPGEHTIGKRPIYSWVPSIGISNLIRYKGDKFSSWKNDFIVSSLYGRNYGKSLFRVKVNDGRVVVVERIQIGRPIRDLVELPDGSVLLWDGMSVASLLEPATLAFSTCAGCHALRWRTHGIGPDLMAVVGEKVARHGGYNYSDAMRNYGGIWSRDRLDRFLENPQKEVPGTSMVFGGIDDAVRRKEIIDYLEQLRLPPN